MAIGRIVRNKEFLTQVNSGDKCASACVLILAAGVLRGAEDGSVVGIHRPYFEPKYFAGLSPEDARSKYTYMTQKVRVYLSEMGMSDRLFEQMMRVASYDVKTLSTREMVDLNLDGLDPAYEERQRAEDVVEYGADNIKGRDAYYQRMRRYAERCMSSGKTQIECMMEFEHTEPPPRLSEPTGKPDFSRFSTPVEPSERRQGKTPAPVQNLDPQEILNGLGR
jgi:hypothetical protein